MSIQINFVKSDMIDMLKITMGIFNKLFYGILHRNSGRVTFRNNRSLQACRVVTANEDLSRIDARGGTGQFIGFMAVMILA